MRKPSFFSLCVIMALFLIFSCSFTQPQKTVVLNLAAQNCGFLLVQEKPELTQDILRYSKKMLELGNWDKPEIQFNVWISAIIEKLEIDPFLIMNFKEMLKLVDIEITLAENQKEITELVYGVIESFIAGIRAKR